MPLLLRRSAPSPSIDQLAFSVPAAPLRSTSGSGSNNNNNSSSNTLLRSSASSEAMVQHYAQLQRCSTHARLSMARRQSTASSLNAELLVCTIEGCERDDCSDPQHLSSIVLRDGSSIGDDDVDDYSSSSRHDSEQRASLRQSSIRASSKKSAPGEPKHEHDDDTGTSEYNYGSEAGGRVSSIRSCACSCRDGDDACVTASNITIEEKQLAVVDRELRDLRKTLADKLYNRLSKMSMTFGRKRGSSTPQLTAS